MLVVRAVSGDDLEQLHELVQQSEFGLTTLQVSRDRMEERIRNSRFAFEREINKPSGEPYIFVMEDLKRGRIVGTSAIYSKVGGYEPFYSYELKTKIRESKELGVRKEIKALHLTKIHDGPTEIGSLFLAPDYWGSGLGRQLSISRFLFMAQFPQRFDDETIAEMRGVVNADGHSPLWDALGAHFFQVDYPKADTLTAESKSIIADLMPEHPIYLPLLPKSAQEVIGQVHPNTVPALKLLEHEGFEFRNLVDIFDGGPAMHCATKQIRSIRESQTGPVAEIVESLESDQRLICNDRVDGFHACVGPVRCEEGAVTIDQIVALQLDLKVGDKIRWVTLR